MPGESERFIFTSAPAAAEAAEGELLRELPDCGHALWLAPGVGLISAGLAFDAIAHRLKGGRSMFIRHICPVGEEVPLRLRGSSRVCGPPPATNVYATRGGGAAGTPSDTVRGRAPECLVTGAPTAEDLEASRCLEEVAAVAVRCAVALGSPFSVQTRLLGDPSAYGAYGRFDVNQAVSEALCETGLSLNVTDPAYVLSVVASGDRAYIGASAVAHNLSGWAGGERRFRKDDDQISRAEFKLLEAFEALDGLAGVRLARKKGVAARAALDLGAAPGGWTRVLRALGMRVVAVDPAALDPRVAADRGVTHHRITSQEYLPTTDTFDLIVNDMRMDARDSARIMCEVAGCLAPGGAALITLKLPEGAPEHTARQALALLAKSYTVADARQLFHNRSEVTVSLTPRITAL